jgi:crotonobetainyl-CoA:carnitine CoA-transferase CaiB-like acyl-CoA transferase
VTAVLHGIRVLDFGRYIASPYCAALLAEYGAEVIRSSGAVAARTGRWHRSRRAATARCSCR